MKIYILLAIGLISLSTLGQEKLEIIDLDGINASMALKSEERDYEGVLELLNSINKNDSVYASSLIRKSFYLMALNRFDDAISTLDEGLALDTGDLKSSFYQNKGVALINQKKFDKAVAAFDEGLKLFPANYLLLFNKAVALQEKGQLEEAVKILEQVIALSPFYAKAYAQLGYIYYSQERPSQALLAFDLALLVEPDGENSFGRLKAVNAMFNSKNENKRTQGLILSKDDQAFDDIDLIISNRVALNKDYKIGNDLDFDLTRQNHALLLSLKNFKGTGGFWSQKIVPFFQWIQNSKNFDAFSYTISYSIENERLKKIVEKKTKVVKEFLTVAIPTWTGIVKIDNKAISNDQRVQYIYDGNALVMTGMGIMKNDKPTGEWHYYNEQGRLTTFANYDKNGERTGKWKWYHPQSKLKETASYKDGKLDGENKIFHSNGQLSIKTFYKNGELQGEYLHYNEKGALIQKKYYKQGKLEGIFTSYFSVGEPIPEYIIPYNRIKYRKKPANISPMENFIPKFRLRSEIDMALKKHFIQMGK